ncbi:MAG: anthranilate synthase component I family protein [Caulobacteraceae bacterium]
MTAARALEPAAWRDPLAVLASFADEPWALGLISDGSARGRWSYLGWNPSRTFSSLAAWRAAMPDRGLLEATVSDHPPFQGGAAGLACYEWGAAQEPAMPQGRSGWPDLAGGLYDKLLAFDHHLKRVWAIGRGDTDAEARARAGQALERLRANGPPPGAAHAQDFRAVVPGQAHQAAVGAVVAAIGRGDLFQANVARPWAGRLEPGCTPFDVLARLAQESPAPFAGYLRLPGRAVVSNSPERFIEVTAEGQAQTRPIKGTRPRGATADEDRRLAEELLASPKDRAENLMIVDLMRNDLARACRPGTVKVEAFCALETYANVHHLVSTVTGHLKPDQGALDLFSAAFPAGSITGAPKIQAMREIARHETPRGPYCGSMFWAGLDGAFDSSVLIRTLAFEEDAGGWTFETRAGGGITADSDPADEDAEAEAKIAAIRRALTA